MNLQDGERILADEDEREYVFRVTVYHSPRYYQGELPLRFEVAYGWQSGLLHWADLGGWKVNVIRGNLQNIPLEVEAIQNGKRLAVAELVDSKNGLTYQEKHYGANGEVIFRCTSSFDIFGNKNLERHQMGMKMHEYFYVIPYNEHVNSIIRQP